MSGINMTVGARCCLWTSAIFLFLYCTLTMGNFWAQPQHADADADADSDADSPQSVVILGAGIIGLVTAYSLLTEWETLVLAGDPAAQARPRPEVVIVEPSKRWSPATSSQATGGLGDFGFAPETTPLGMLSFRLLADLARQANGKEGYQFTQQTIFRVTPKDFTGVPNPPDTWGPSPPVHVPLSSLPNWFKTESDWTAHRLATAPHGAHLDPAQFCAFMYERCKQLKVQFAFGSEVTSVSVDEASQRFKSVELQELGGASRTVPCQTLVIAAGPWSDRVFSRLFPLAKTSVPFDISGSAGNHFRVRTPGWKPSDDEKGSEQVFLGSVIPGDHSLDITSFPGGTLYIGGYGAIPELLPEYADFVKPQPTQIEAMLELTRKYLGLPPDEVLEILDLGRAYRPWAVPNHPIITKVDWGLLGIEGSTNNPFESQLPIATSDKPSAGCASVVGGLFVNTGHHSDGLTLSLGSGKVMGELLLGQEPSVDISGLGLPQN